MGDNRHSAASLKLMYKRPSDHVLSLVCDCVFTVWWTMVPASMLAGVAACLLWTGQSAYFTITGKEYAKIKGQKTEDAISFFFGIFSMIALSSMLFSSIISSTVLQQSPPENYTGPSEADLALCGINDCPGKNVTNVHLEKPADHLVWTLVGIYFCVAVVGFIVSIVYDDSIPAYLLNDSKDEITTSLKATFVQMIRPKQLALVPITMFLGMEQAFKAADWNISYITCNIGIWMIGYSTISFGSCAALSAIISGRLAKITGRFLILSVAMCAELGFFLTCILWTPNPEELSKFFVTIGLGGVGDGVLQTILKSCYGFIFIENSEAAFGNFQFWKSVGFAIAFAYSSRLCMRIKIYILITFLVLGMVLYGVVEWSVWTRKSKPDVEDHPEEKERLDSDLENLPRPDEPRES